MRKALVSSLIIFNTVLIAQTAEQPSGSGTEADPYQISTLNNLYWITQNSDEWGKYYKQTADIDASGTSSWDNNAGFSPIGGLTTKFTGTYDGQGYTIDGLTIDRSSTDRGGLFGSTNGATISNVGVINVSIKGQYYVGALVGVTTSTNIATCYSTGSVTGTGQIGGLVGMNTNSSSITNSYSKCSVSGSDDGGLVGYNQINSTIVNCYSTGSGGSLVPRNDGTVTDSFWDTETSGAIDYFLTGGTGKTTAEMKTANTFTSSNWDFEIETTNGSNDYWDMDPSYTYNSGYPFLSWQNGATILITNAYLVQGPDTTAPATPTSLHATPGNTQVILTWTANSESDLASYKVYGGTSASPTTLVSTVAAGTEIYTHSNLTNGTIYYYRISAVDNASNESIKTADVSTTPYTIHTVKTDGTGNYTSIQTAIDASSNGDTVFVYQGTYTENIAFKGNNIVVISKSGAASTIVEPANNSIPTIWFYSAETSDTALNGFTIRNGGDIRGSAIKSEGHSKPVIQNCIITNSSGEAAIGFYYSGATLINCLIHHNPSSRVFFWDPTDYSVQIINCTIVDNTGSRGLGNNSITTGPEYTNCIIYNNGKEGDFGNVTMTYSLVEGGWAGIGNIDTEPFFANTSDNDYHLSNYSPSIGAGTSSGAPSTDIEGNPRPNPAESNPDMGVYENPLAFSSFDLVYPFPDTTIVLTRANFLDTLYFAWNQPASREGDELTYKRELTGDLPEYIR
ncbi:MAG: right-handed parallel beta-helix repeat-containing protein, partial [Anaerolineales bacterium]|nr:right-handed parallel beta-helix repeat-containing protein [Anaerolineales bacterium]